MIDTSARPIQGSCVALVTPMHEDTSLDFEAYRRLIEWHKTEGTDALVVVGTTGESPSVDREEHIELIRVAVEQAAGYFPVIAGTGGNSTHEAIELTRHAKKLGASATLQVVPYYNKPTQEGLYRHFCAIAEAVDLPLILYNVPGRTGADLLNATILRLAQVPGIIGLKDATGDVGRAAELLLHLPHSFSLYGGNDDSAFPLIALGARGVISVTANVAPRLMARVCHAALHGHWEEARRLNLQLMPLHKNLFVESNPIPVKWALHKMGHIGPGIRLPLTSLTPSSHALVQDALQKAGLIPE